jgi:di/tricarboxylate transporter
MKLRRAAAVCIAILTVVALAAGFVSASLVAVTGLVFIGALLRPRGLVGVIDFGLAATLAGALAFGLVLQSSGLVEGVAETVIGFAGGNALLMLIALGVCTGICTELVSNIAAAAMMAPLGFALAEGSAVSTEAATMTVMLAASASFATPFGYQTNLMVAGPGGYRYGDFIRCGLTLNIWFAVGAAVLSYWYFPALVF